MQAAAKYMTPVTLECGGKSPTYIDNSADLNVTAKRILWGRFANSGKIVLY
jgi:aldehyde dehydrogenase (NAD+)